MSQFSSALHTITFLDRPLYRSLGVDRDTVRRYVRLAQKVGLQRDQPFPEESELVRRLQAIQDSVKGWGSDLNIEINFVLAAESGNDF